MTPYRSRNFLQSAGHNLLAGTFFGFLAGVYFFVFGSANFILSKSFRTLLPEDKYFHMKWEVLANLTVFTILGLLAGVLLSVFLRRYHFRNFRQTLILIAPIYVVTLVIEVIVMRMSAFIGRLGPLLQIIPYLGAVAAPIVFFLLCYYLARKLPFGAVSGGLAAVVVGGVLVLAGWRLLGGTSELKAANQTDNYNIIWITIDTQAHDHLSYTGYPRKTSPNIDKFAEEALNFTQAYTAVSRTFPSLSSWNTGKYPHNHGARNNFHHALADANVTIAEALSDFGYRTGAVVSNAGLSVLRKMNQGYDYYLETNHQILQIQKIPALVLLQITGLVYPLRTYIDYGAMRTANIAIDFLRREAGNNLFLWVHFFDPHMDYNPPRPYAETFGKGYDDQYGNNFVYNYKKPENADWIDDDHPAGYEYGMGEIVFRCPLPQETIEHAIALYDEEVLYTDYEIGRLFDAIRELGLWDKSMILVSADHGESLGEHDYYFSHGDYVYNASMNIPMLVKMPKDKAVTGTIDTPISAIDLMPTSLELVGCPIPDGLDGIPLQELIYEGPPRVPRPIFGESGICIFPELCDKMILKVHVSEPNTIPPEVWFAEYERPFNEAKFRMMVLDTWKIIYTPDGGDGVWELYDLAADPGETVNLWDERQDVGEPMKDLLLAWVAEDTGEGYYEGISLDNELGDALRALGYIQ